MKECCQVDIAASGEINSNRDETGHQIVGIEPRLILSKQLGKLNMTFNLSAEFPFSRHHFGTELRYDTQEHAVAVIPQIWVTLPHKVTLKAGYSYDFGTTHEKFFRTAVVIEF